MKSDTIPEITLERYILNELPEKRMREIARMSKSDPALMRRIEGLKESNRILLETHPPQGMTAAIESRLRAATRAESAGKNKARGLIRGLSRPQFIGPVMAAVTAAVVIAVFIPGIRTGHESGAREGVDITRVKGSGSSLYLYRKKNSSVERIKNGARVREGDLLQIACVASQEGFGAVLSIDGRGSVTLHLPADGGRAVRLVPGKKFVLPLAYELDDAPYFERFFLITSKSPFGQDDVVPAARKLARKPERARQAGLELGSGLEQTSLIVVKEGKS